MYRVAKFLLLGSIKRDPPRTPTIELARFDHAAFDPVMDNVCADRETICNLPHGKFFRPLEAD